MERTEGGETTEFHVPKRAVCTKCGSPIQDGEWMKSTGLKEGGEVGVQHLFDSDCDPAEQGDDDGED